MTTPSKFQTTLAAHRANLLNDGRWICTCSTVKERLYFDDLVDHAAHVEAMVTEAGMAIVDRKLIADTVQMFRSIEDGKQLYYAPVHHMVDLLAAAAEADRV